MKNLKPQFDFDDILIVPKYKTHVSSRYDGITLSKTLPLFSAPMDTVVNLDNMDFFRKFGISVTLPRTITYNKYIEHGTRKDVFISMGFNDIDVHLKTDLRNIYPDCHILIDVANGHMQKLFDYSREIKRLRPDIVLMIGNIANPETYLWYAKNTDVDYIRVGVGNGCFAAGTRILMSSGIYKNIENICHGDEIVTMNGTVAKVKRLIFKGKKNVVELKTSMSPRNTLVTPGHNYYTGNYKKEDIRK